MPPQILRAKPAVQIVAYDALNSGFYPQPPQHRQSRGDHAPALNALPMDLRLPVGSGQAVNVHQMIQAGIIDSNDLHIFPLFFGFRFGALP